MRQFLKNLLKPDPAPASAPAPETEGQVPPPDRFPEARALQKQGQLEQARQIYEAILAANPQHFGALHYLGVTLFQMGDASAAVEWINRAIAVDAAVADAYFNLGNVMRALNRHDAAIANYDQAIALKPDDAEAFNNRGIVQEQIGQNDAALASFARAIDANWGPINNPTTLKESIMSANGGAAHAERTVPNKPRSSGSFTGPGSSSVSSGPSLNSAGSMQ